MAAAKPTELSKRSEPDASREMRSLGLRQGRTLTVVPEGTGDLVEIRGASGLLELRVKMTDQGAVLQMESVRISLKAAESVDVTCKEFNVNAEKSVDLSSQGGIKVSGQADVSVDASGEVHVKGTMIYLN